MPTTLEKGFIGLTVLTQVAYYLTKLDYYRNPVARQQLSQDIHARKSRGELFPRLKAYAPVYLPFPFDIYAERNTIKIERT